MTQSDTAIDRYLQAIRDIQGHAVDQSADRALDSGGISGDALLDLSGLAPSSTINGALLWNSLVAETARLLLQPGVTPPVFVSLNVAGAAEHDQALLDKWRPRNIHL